MADLQKNPFVVPIGEQELQTLFPAEHIEISYIQYHLSGDHPFQNKLELLINLKLQHTQQYFSFREEYLKLLPDIAEIEKDQKRKQHFDWVKTSMETNADILLFIEQKILELYSTPPQAKEADKSLKNKRKRNLEPPVLSPNQILILFNILRHYKVITSTAENTGFCIEQLTSYGAEYARKNLSSPDFNRDDVSKVLEILNQITSRLNQSL